MGAVRQSSDKEMSTSEENKKSLTERDICTKYITPALVSAGWDLQSQPREEVTFTAGRAATKGVS